MKLSVIVLGSILVLTLAVLIVTRGTSTHERASPEIQQAPVPIDPRDHQITNTSSLVDPQSAPVSSLAWCLRVRVRDALDGTAVPRASVLIHCPDHRALSASEGLTNEDGECAILPAAGFVDCSWVLHVSASNHEAIEQSIQPRTALIDIALAPNDVLKGTVVRQSGKHVGPGVVVICKPSRSGFLSIAALRAALSRPEHSEPFLTRTDENGEFVIRDLESGKHYDLHAGGHGLVCHPTVRSLRVPQLSITVPVQIVYGSLIRLLESDGRPITLSPGFYINGTKGLNTRIWSKDGGISFFPGDDISFLLASGDPDLLPNRPFSELILMVTTNEANSVGPVVIRCNVPGYRTMQQEFWSRPINEEINTIDIKLVRECDDWGNVAISAVGVPLDAEQMCGCEELSGFLVLVGEGGREDWIPAILPFNGVNMIESVPQGDYQLYFRDLQGLKLPANGNPSSIISIGYDGNQAQFDLSMLGGVAFRLTDGNGNSYEGTLVVDVASGIPQVEGSKTRRENVAQFRIQSSPHRILSLSAGIHSFRITYPRVGDSGSPLQMLDILPGIIQDVHLPWVPENN